MHRIEGANNINNLFTDGPPGTTVVAPWLNSVQEEICTAIEEAGITLKQQSNDTNRDQLWAAINLLTTPGNIVVSFNNSPYYINDTLKDIIVYVDSSAGDVDIYLPPLANNYHKRIKIMHSVGGNLLTVYRSGSDFISRDDLISIELPKEGNYLEVLGSALSNRWDITQEAISCQLRLDTYAGYGSIDNKIMRFTNSREDFGNVFSHNHGSYGTAGLEIIIKKSGKYGLFFVYDASVGEGYYAGLSLNSLQLTISISSINVQDRLMFAHDTNVGSSIPIPVEKYFEKDSIIRPHTNGSVPDAPSYCHIIITYIGN